MNIENSHGFANATSIAQKYTPDSFLLSSPQGSIIIEEPAYESIPAARAIAELGAAPPGTVLAGAFPFDRSEPARLAFSKCAIRGAQWKQQDFPKDPALQWTREGSRSADVYRDGVRTVLDRLRDGRLEKVVLARSLELTANEPIDRLLMLKRLAARDPHAYTYAVNLGGRTLIGASPELLVSVRDGIVATNPLAGSAPRDPDPERDALNAAALSTSAKDLHEHTFVVTAIRDALAPLCRELTIPSTPALLTTATMWHLSSRISGRAREGVTALDIALALHPTPAVCGVPADLAYEVIKELEPFDRGFYAGMVGWTDARGDGDWVVTIRCGEVDSKHVRLFAGAGIVPASTPDAELAETEAKLQTLLLTIGAVEARDVA